MARFFASNADSPTKWIALVAAALACACGDRVLDVGHDPSSGDDAGPRVATVVASRQVSLRSIALDEKRLYWALDGLGDSQNPDEALRERGVIRSCDPNDCAATVITYATGQLGTSRIAVAGGKIYWAAQDPSSQPTAQFAIFACAVEGCGGQPEFIVGVPTMVEIAVDGTYLFWLNGNSELLRCSPTDCANTQVTHAKTREPSGGDRSNPFLQGNLALGPTQVYWIEEATSARPGAIMTLPKEGTLAPRALVTDLHAPFQLVTTSTNVTWIEYYSLGEIRSCPLLDCSSGMATIAPRQPYATLLAAEGDGVYWFGRRGRPWDDREEAPADLFECGTAGCGKESPPVMTVESKVPQQTAIDRTHVYWISRGDSLADRAPSNSPYEGSIKRIRRTR